MAKTSRDAYRHIREMSALFSDVNTIGSAMVEEMLRKSKQRKHLKQSLRRLVKRGFLVSDDDGFTPTAKGLIHFRRFHSPKILRETNSSTNAGWDNKWRLITFDVPCKEDTKRCQIRSFLKEFDFYQLQKSVWISPVAVSKKFWNILVKSDLDKYCKTMVVDIIEGDEEIRKYFNIVLGIVALFLLPDLLSC